MGKKKLELTPTPYRRSNLELKQNQFDHIKYDKLQNL